LETAGDVFYRAHAVSDAEPTVPSREHNTLNSEATHTLSHTHTAFCLYPTDTPSWPTQFSANLFFFLLSAVTDSYLSAEKWLHA